MKALTAARASWLMSSNATPAAPSVEKAVAHALPMLEAAPVTRADPGTSNFFGT